jgi:hypothetical protein
MDYVVTGTDGSMEGPPPTAAEIRGMLDCVDAAMAERRRRDEAMREAARDISPAEVDFIFPSVP